MIELLLALIGFLAGIALSVIAPEELKPGKKYFLFTKKILFYLILFFSIFLFVYFSNYYFVFIPITYFLASFFVKKWVELYNYGFYVLIMIMVYIHIDNQLLIILPSLIFLYGLPTGTLFRLRLMEKHEARRNSKKES